MIIAMLGNVFSPRYLAARRAYGALATPLTYSSFHVVLNGRTSRFTLTETDAVERAPDSLRIGASALTWTGHELCATIDERTAFGRRVTGQLRLDVRGLLDHEVSLDRHGRHRWTPLAPSVRAEVELSSPKLRFAGHAYVDANEGDEGLERGFLQWSWARLAQDDGGTLIAYDTKETDEHATARLFSVHGARIESLDPRSLTPEPMPRTLFRLQPSVRLDPGGLTRASSMTSAPFYCRTEIEGRALGAPARGVHEWLDLRRFQNEWVQRMVPYRMRGGFPRAGEPR